MGREQKESHLGGSTVIYLGSSCFSSNDPSPKKKQKDPKTAKGPKPDSAAKAKKSKSRAERRANLEAQLAAEAE